MKNLSFIKSLIYKKIPKSILPLTLFKKVHEL